MNIFIPNNNPLIMKNPYKNKTFYIQYCNKYP